MSKSSHAVRAAALAGALGVVTALAVAYVRAMRKPALVVALAWSFAGCGPSADEIVSRDLGHRVNACIDGTRVGAVFVEAWVRGARLHPTTISGLSADEELCVRDLVAEQVVHGLGPGYGMRVRIERERDTHPALRFLRAQRAAVTACRPCSTTRIVATPAGDRYELAAELVGDEPELGPDERACIAAALADMPPPPDDDAREAVAAFGGSCR